MQDNNMIANQKLFMWALVLYLSAKDDFYIIWYQLASDFIMQGNLSWILRFFRLVYSFPYTFACIWFWAKSTLTYICLHTELKSTARKHKNLSQNLWYDDTDH